MAKTKGELMDELIKKLPENIGRAISIIASDYPDAQHHEHYAIDQVMRVLLGDYYQDFVDAFESPRGDKGERWIDNWDEGVAP